MSEWNHDIRDVIETYTNINLALLVCDNDLCTNNSTRIPSEWRDDISTSYLIQLRCTECDIEWMVCKNCSLKKKLIKNEQIRCHKWKYHDRKRKATSLDNNAYIIHNKKLHNYDTNKMICHNEGNNIENMINSNNIKTHGKYNNLFFEDYNTL
jgi:hypothetical protein